MFNVRKFLVIITAMFVVMAIIGLATLNAGEETKEFKGHKLGCKIVPDSKLPLNKKMKTETSKTKIAKSIDLSSKMPSSGDQGNQGSCTAWATGYSYKSYQYGIKYNKLPNSSKRQFSPSYIYNQIHIGEDEGSTIVDAMELLRVQGCCKLFDMPYYDWDYTTQPTTAQIQKASGYKTKSWNYINGGDLKNVKKHLAKKDPVVVGIPVYDDFDQENGGNMNYNKIEGELHGYHAICIVGYNDTTKKLKFQNSWGKTYGKSGRGYISYSLFDNNFDNQYNYASFYMNWK